MCWCSSCISSKHHRELGFGALCKLLQWSSSFPGALLVATDCQLLAHGWTRLAIARAISGPNARQLQIGRGERVLASTAEKVARLHAHALAHVIEERRLVAERQAAYRAAKREAAA